MISFLMKSVSPCLRVRACSVPSGARTNPWTAEKTEDTEQDQHGETGIRRLPNDFVLNEIRASVLRPFVLSGYPYDRCTPEKTEGEEQDQHGGRGHGVVIVLYLKRVLHRPSRLAR